MNRWIAAVAVVASLALAVPDARAQGAVEYDDIFQSAADSIDERIVGIPDPPVSKADKDQRKALDKARSAIDKARAKPVPAGFVKAAAKIEASLAKVFPGDVDVGELRTLLSWGMGQAVETDVQRGLQDLGSLPAGASRDALQATLDGLLDDLSGLGLLENREFYRALSPLAAKVTAARKKFDKLMAPLVGKPGMTARVDGQPFSVTLVTGTMVVDSISGQPTAITLVAKSGDSFFSQTITLTLTKTGPGETFSAGTTTIESGEATGRFVEREGKLNTKTIDGSAGSVTLITLNPASGAVGGTFSFTGPSDVGTGAVTVGKFNVSGLDVTSN